MSTLLVVYPPGLGGGDGQEVGQEMAGNYVDVEVMPCVVSGEAVTSWR